MDSEAQNRQLQFTLIPLMCPGHLIPMTDMAKVLAQRGVDVTVITTPLNASRISPLIDSAVNSGLPITLLSIRFPTAEAGLPEGSENMDTLPSRQSVANFIAAVNLLEQPMEQLIRGFKRLPDCIISDRFLSFTAKIAKSLGIPRIMFDGMSAFSSLCNYNLQVSQIHECYGDFEPILLPGLPDKIQLNRAQLPPPFKSESLALEDVREEIRVAEAEAYGVVVNTFEELEPRYVAEYRSLKKGKVWCVGPLSVCNKDSLDKAQRGNKTSIDVSQCLKWLDSQPKGSVVYTCLGSLIRLSPSQLMEFGLGLEASNRPFIWAVRGGDRTEELERLIMEEGFEERVKGRGFLIRGWAPQILILSHPSIGAFLTHCGWNSMLEGISAGLQMIACPLFAEQFYNEKLLAQVLGIGVGVVANSALHWGGEEKFGLLIKKEQIKEAIDVIMDESRGDNRRIKVTELGKMARQAVEEGGSSFAGITQLLEDIKKTCLEQFVKGLKRPTSVTVNFYFQDGEQFSSVTVL